MHNPLAQAVQEPHWMFASDKVYTVLAVCLVILGGIFSLLLSLELRLHRLEKSRKDLR